MLDTLLALDRHLFFLVNGQWHAPWLDMLLAFMRNPYFWAPLYLFLLTFMPFNFEWKGWWWLLFFAGTFALTDAVCGNVLKEMFVRYRPCNDPLMVHATRSLVPCAGRHCFPSNHAANHFALGMFMFLTLRRRFGSWMWLALAWAFLVSYAQVYVGQHYPSDVIAGSLFGLLTGTLTGRIYNTKIALTPA